MSVIIVITLMCIIRHKCIGKRLADGHDLGDVNVKRSSSNDVGEQIEMSALIETQNVSHCPSSGLMPVWHGHQARNDGETLKLEYSCSRL